MLKDITLGQYYPAKSVIHSLDPRVKLLALMCYMIFVFLNDFLLGFILNIIVLVVLIRLANIPVKLMMRGLKSIFMLLLISVLFTLLFTQGEHPLLDWGMIHISVEGVILSVKITVRLVLLIIMSTLFTLSTSPTDIADGLEKSCSSFRKIGVPVHEIAMMITIALRFIPILMEETEKIMRAQKARGVDFESGSFIRKAKKMVPIFIPLMISSVRRSTDLAMAMEARCYRGGDGRTKMKPLIYERRDKVAYGIMLAYAVGMLALWIMVTFML